MPDYRSDYTGPEIDNRLRSVPDKANNESLANVTKMIAPLWAQGHHYIRGEHVAHGERLYVCRQDHDSGAQFQAQYWESETVAQYLGEHGLVPSAVLYTPQDLSAGQKEQARANIGAVGHIQVLTAIPAAGMLPNVMYALGELATDPDISIASGFDATKDNEWMLTFETGATAPASVTFPNTVIFPDTPSFEANKHYEVSMKWDVTDSCFYALVQSFDRPADE